MKTITVVLSKGSQDFGCWLKELKGVYGAGDTPETALYNLQNALAIYRKHNVDAPKWLRSGSYTIAFESRHSPSS